MALFFLLKSECFTSKGCFVPGLMDIFVQWVLLSYRFYLPMENSKDVTLHLNEFEFPSPKDALCQVWLKFVQWFWRSLKCAKFTDGRETAGNVEIFLELV